MVSASADDPDRKPRVDDTSDTLVSASCDSFSFLVSFSADDTTFRVEDWFGRFFQIRSHRPCASLKLEPFCRFRELEGRLALKDRQTLRNVDTGAG